MNSNNKLSLEMIQDDLEGLSKKLYLESPDLWMDFLDKTGNNKFDEMVLFFAVKHDFPNIIRYVVENNLIDLDKPSKNKSFNSIKNHLLSIATNSKTKQYLLGITNENFNQNDSSNDIGICTENHVYTPEFNCPNCNSNIFNTGYTVNNETTYKFSTEKKKVEPISSKISNYVSCVNCGHNIKEINHNTLENLCTIENCSSCGGNLIKIGIVDRAKMTFDNDSKKFIKQNTTYHCFKCNKELNKLQLEHFKL